MFRKHSLLSLSSSCSLVAFLVFVLTTTMVNAMIFHDLTSPETESENNANTGQSKQQIETVTPDQALATIGQKEVVVRMTVQQSKDRMAKRGIIFLDSEDDFQKAGNLGIAVSLKAAQAFKRKGVDDLAAHLKGKTIEVTGCVMQFEERFYIPVLDADQITLVDTAQQPIPSQEPAKVKQIP